MSCCVWNGTRNAGVAHNWQYVFRSVMQCLAACGVAINDCKLVMHFSHVKSRLADTCTDAVTHCMHALWEWPWWYADVSDRARQGQNGQGSTLQRPKPTPIRPLDSGQHQVAFCCEVFA